MSAPLDSLQNTRKKGGRKNSLNFKLVLLITFISFSVLILTLVLGMCFETVVIRKQLMNSYQTTVNMVSSSLEAAVVFKDRFDSKEILSVLDQHNSFKQAVVLIKDGEVLASYVDRDQENEIVLSQNMKTRFEGHRFYINQPVVVKGHQLGSLLTYGESKEYISYLKMKGVLLISMLILALFAAILLANRFGKLIIGPILNLAFTAEKIKDRQDFSIRQASVSNDELGMLTESFNEMMDQLEKQNNIINANARRFRNYFDLGIVGMAVLDRNLELIEQNDRFLDILKFDSQGVHASNWIELVEDNSHNFKETIEKLKNDTLREFTGECWFRGGGCPVYAIVSIRSIPQSETEPKHFLMLVQDISDRKTYEEALINAKEKAEASNKAKNEFLSVMSHELRTPLNPIIGFTDLIKMETSNPNILQSVNNIHRAGDHLLSLINSILDYTKIEKGGVQLEFSVFELGELCDEVMQLVQSQYEEKGISHDIQHSISSQDGTSNKGVKVVADRTKLSQLLFNLLENAFKFTNEGEVKLATHLEIENSMRAVLNIEVSDTGMGIERESIDKIFDPFQQLDGSLSRKYGGIGLGLAICGKIVRLFEGNIHCESELGKGSSFKISFGVSLSSQEVVKDQLHHGKKKARGNSSGKILLVEDDPVNQELIVALLSKLGYEVDLAVDGRQGVEKATAFEYNMILMDLQLPELSGMEATQLIREKGTIRKNTPIVALTAHAAIISREDCIRKGMDDYLSKPFNLNQLAHMISSVEEKVSA